MRKVIEKPFVQMCCEKMTEEVKTEQIEWVSFLKGWYVNGCCGGGCYVLSGIKFCPYCGKTLKSPIDMPSTD